jgi:hypothetical protein
MVTYYALSEAPISNQTSASVRDLGYAGSGRRTVPSLHMRANGIAWEHCRLKLNKHERGPNAELANTLIPAVFAVFVECRDLVAA